MNDRQTNRPTAKKPYGTPTLRRYGGVSELTRAAMDSGANADGAKGKTNKT